MIDRRILLLLCAGAGLAAVVAAELRAGGGDAEIAAKPPARAAAEPATPLAPRTPVNELISVALARPLFSPSRRPAEEGGPVEQDFDKRLAGIIIAPGRRLAIFAAAAGGKPLIMNEGDSVGGWEIESIKPGEISLRGPTGSKTLQPKLDPALAVRRPPPLPGQATAPAIPTAQPVQVQPQTPVLSRRARQQGRR